MVHRDRVDGALVLVDVVLGWSAESLCPHQWSVGGSIKFPL